MCKAIAAPAIVQLRPGATEPGSDKPEAGVSAVVATVTAVVNVFAQAISRARDAMNSHAEQAARPQPTNIIGPSDPVPYDATDSIAGASQSSFPEASPQKVQTEATARDDMEILIKAMDDMNSHTTMAALPQPTNFGPSDPVPYDATAHADAIMAGFADLKDKMPAHQLIDVATYNMYYQSGGSTYDDIEEISRKHEIFGLQEVSEGTDVHNVVDNSSDTHDVYLGQPKSGEKKGFGLIQGGSVPEYCPIFFDKNRYEAVGAQSVQLHGENFNGEGGSSRVANFLMLKDKTDDSTLLVVNTHWSNTSAEAQTQSQSVINAKIEEFKANYPVDGVVALGDFNNSKPKLAGLSDDMKDGHIDLVLTDENIKRHGSTVMDGGESDHDIVSSTISVNEISNDPRKNTLNPISDTGIESILSTSVELDFTFDAM
jgi:endonuclease/exonuclease/phosphatase family metal-dependent hydrolase